MLMNHLDIPKIEKNNVQLIRKVKSSVHVFSLTC